VIKELKANDVNTITLVSAANGRYGKMRSTKRSRILYPASDPVSAEQPVSPSADRDNSKS
jgi:hypothetical protein